jgi:hypothetical protein
MSRDRNPAPTTRAARLHRQTTKANSNPNHETDWMNRLADAKRKIAIDLLWVKVGAKEVVPNWKKHRKLRL